MRSTSRVVGCGFNTVARPLVRAGQEAWIFHDETVRGVKTSRVECDEIWSFAYAKRLNLPRLKNVPSWAGDVWTWTALASNSRLFVSVAVGDRSEHTAGIFLGDLAERLEGRIQLSTDGHVAYPDAVRAVFGEDVDYGQIVKDFAGGSVSPDPSKQRYSPGPLIGLWKRTISRVPDEDMISTSYIERSNLTLRMGVKRYTRLSNAFSKRVYNHWCATVLFMTHYNFCRPHVSLGRLRTPAMAAGLTKRPLDMDFLVEMIEARELAAVRKRGPYQEAFSVRLRLTRAGIAARAVGTSHASGTGGCTTRLSDCLLVVTVATFRPYGSNPCRKGDAVHLGWSQKDARQRVRVKMQTAIGWVVFRSPVVDYVPAEKRGIVTIVGRRFGDIHDQVTLVGLIIFCAFECGGDGKLVCWHPTTYAQSGVRLALHLAQSVPRHHHSHCVHGHNGGDVAASVHQERHSSEYLKFLDLDGALQIRALGCATESSDNHRIIVLGFVFIKRTIAWPRSKPRASRSASTWSKSGPCARTSPV